ncbi:MAG: hypothetical protein J0G96_04305 [Flavobacteriia bacterium]|nr:hypothetical protein [Flavobacteriia bacterium]OJX36993.1 MAG: hypothetical protein BGO87_14535 [Flavobacteriia bacterium 40-80]
MKLIIYTSLFLAFIFQGHSQKNINLMIGISNTYSLNIMPTFNSYSGTNISVGSQIETKKGNFNILGTYQFSGNYSRGTVFSLQSHLLGIIFQYRILSNKRRFSPFFEIKGLTEVGTNYKNGYMSIDYWFPSIYPEEFSKWVYSSRFYVGTPFVGNLLLGCDIRLTGGLHLNISAGYGLRVMQTRYADWLYDPVPPKEEIYKKPVKTRNFQMLDVQLGISYAFSFKKKK